MEFIWKIVQILFAMRTATHQRKGVEHSYECCCVHKNSSERLLLSNAIIIVFIRRIRLYNTLCVDIYALYLVIFEIFLETVTLIIMIE